MDDANPTVTAELPRTPARRISRRRFLLGAGATGVAGLAGAAFLARPWDALAGPASPSHSDAAASAAGPLVLITLYGGNDGLNTVVPYGDSAYHAARPTLGYSPSQVLDIGDGLALNPQLKGFQSVWNAGQLAIVRGVGYPNPSLSHFEAMDIWQTANPVDGSGAGWVGRWLDATGDDPMRAISIGATLPLLLRGDTQSATAITGPRITLPGDPAFQQAFAALQDPGSDRVELSALVAACGSELLEVQKQLDALPSPASVTGGMATPAATSETAAGALSGQLQTVAALINAGAPTKLYQVSLASFDTHADEKTNQERLLAELDQSVTAFLAALGTGSHARNAVVMTYSEFGRRPLENASGGTDHGAAAPLFVVGRTVHGGKFYGEEPSLTALDANGNLRYNTDFRSVYATVLERVIGVDPVSILGGKYPTLGFV